MTDTNEILTAEEAAQLLRVCPSQIRTQRYTGPLREADVRRKGNQTGSVRYKSGAWYIRFNEWRLVNGAWKWSDTERKIDDGGKKLTEAKALILGYDQHVSKANQLNKAPQGLSTLETFIDVHYTPSVVARYHGQWKRTVEGIIKNHIVPAFGSLMLNEIRKPMVQDWVNRLSQSHSGQTVKHCANILKAIFDHAADSFDLETRNPAERLKLPRIDAKQKQALTMDQVRQIAAKLRTKYERPEYARLVMLLGVTGLRIGEALGLRWRFVDFENLTLDIVQSFSAGQWGPTKTQSSRRTVEITQEIADVLREQLAMTKWNGEDHTVFTSNRGTPLDYGNIESRFLKPACEELGLGDVSWHTFRHTTASIMDPYATIAEKKAQLGHTSTKMSERYTHVRPGALREVLEKATKPTIN